jgi:hypothetical protein
MDLDTSETELFPHWKIVLVDPIHRLRDQLDL